MDHPSSRVANCVRVALVCAALAGAVGAAWAKSAAVDQAMRLGDSAPAAALAILEQADAEGDLDASSTLASTLFFAAPPRQDRVRACAIARRLVDARNGHGWAVMASCVLVGTVETTDRFDAARDSARRAIALGAATGGTALFTAFVVDPRFAVLGPDGQPDPARKAALAAQPASRRLLQSEAWTGLSIALDGNDPMAAGFAIPALASTSAPGNLGRLISLADRSPATAKRFADIVDSARRFLTLGGTHAALRAAQAALPAATSAARAGALRDGIGSCENVDLLRMNPGDVPTDATYLPVKTGPLMNAYLVSGQWEERWVFTACEREVPVQVSFRADGWGGATAAASPAPRSVVRRAP